jgi:hypothetical protein
MNSHIQCKLALTLRVLVYLAMLLLFITSCPLFAQFMARPVDLAYLSQRAGVIVQGKVISVRHENLPGFQNISTVSVTLEVETMLRGPSTKVYTFREAYIGLRAKDGKNDYQTGQRLLLFLPSPSSYGLSSPVGMEQGRFHIGRNAEGAEIVVNEMGNSGLFKNVAQKASMAGKRLPPEQLRIASTKRGPVRLDELIALTKSLILLPKIQ